MLLAVAGRHQIPLQLGHPGQHRLRAPLGLAQRCVPLDLEALDQAPKLLDRPAEAAVVLAQIVVAALDVLEDDLELLGGDGSQRVCRTPQEVAQLPLQIPKHGDQSSTEPTASRSGCRTANS